MVAWIPLVSVATSPLYEAEGVLTLRRAPRARALLTTAAVLAVAAAGSTCRNAPRRGALLAHVAVEAAVAAHRTPGDAVPAAYLLAVVQAVISWPHAVGTIHLATTLVALAAHVGFTPAAAAIVAALGPVGDTATVALLSIVAL